MTRRRSRWPALLLGVAMAFPVQAQDADAPVEWAPRTGSDWIDARLVDMNVYADRYRDAFVDEIVRYHDAPRAFVEQALADPALQPADVYFACALARSTGKPCRELIEAWRADHADGWQGVATRLEIETDAGLQRRLRSDITASYRRWARPIE